jgi:hypothetical protein
MHFSFLAPKDIKISWLFNLLTTGEIHEGVKRQKMVYKTLYEKIEIEDHEPHKTPGLSHSLLMVNQLLLH